MQVRCMAFSLPDDNDKWRAVALEMDIWGFGNTAEEAMRDLGELVNIQIEFAVGKKRLSILNHPADKKWFQVWDILQKIEKENKQKSIISSLAQQKEISSALPHSLSGVKCYYHKAA